MSIDKYKRHSRAICYQDCGWQGDRCAGSPAWTPCLSTPWRYTNKQLEVFPISLVNAPAADVIVVLDARHEMLLGWKPGGSAVWKTNHLLPHHHHLPLPLLCHRQQGRSNSCQGRPAPGHPSPNWTAEMTLSLPLHLLLHPKERILSMLAPATVMESASAACTGRRSRASSPNWEPDSSLKLTRIPGITFMRWKMENC